MTRTQQVTRCVTDSQDTAPLPSAWKKSIGTKQVHLSLSVPLCGLKKERVPDKDRWCFEPSQPQRITLGLKTNVSLPPSYSFHELLYHKSLFLKPQLKFYPQFRNANPKKTITHVLELIYMPRALNTGDLHRAGWPILFCRPSQEPVLATANTAKTCERFWIFLGEWTGREIINEEEIPGSKRSICGCILTSSRL